MKPARPRAHLSPPGGWLNDPNGCVRFDGRWHCFYQHHPDGLSWGPMHWGHAVSDDLIHWQHRPIALRPDPKLGWCYSGSAVPIDGRLALLFTHHLREEHGGPLEVQSLAWGDGQTFALDPDNPILENPGLRHFRDPKVFRHDGRWLMVLTGGDRALLYASDDLRGWHALPPIHAPIPDLWECPELFPLGDAWVLAVSREGGGPQGGSGVEVVVGSFDGTHFEAHGPPTPLDHGSDFYATQTFGGTDRSVQIAWLNNWAYAKTLPVVDWNGCLTLPRALSLEDGCVRQRPVPELARARGGTPGLTADLEIEPTGPGRLHCRQGGDFRTTVWWTDDTLGVDRRHSGAACPGFAAEHTTALPRGPSRLRIIIDATSVEIFADDGRVTMTTHILPPADAVGLDLDGVRGAVRAWGLEP